LRCGPAGIHAFSRGTGWNVLLDEVALPAAYYSRAPRQVSIALTNRCDLACAHCYAPKSREGLSFESVRRWLVELDAAGTLGVGFGGGEPTLYPDFVRLCRYVAEETRLSVSFTTHGHLVDTELVQQLRGSVHFVRVSMDGVGTTYESIRRRAFGELLRRLSDVSSLSRFGINMVVNEQTVSEVEGVARAAEVAGACELLLLPQMSTHRVASASTETILRLRRWVEGYEGPLKLCINESSAEGFPTCDPLLQERGLRAYAHIDANGVLKPTSYSATGVPIEDGTVLGALDALANRATEDIL
jgi:MoaA/NifB/PqqE/SkfB family radical SAM enzyme